MATRHCGSSSQRIISLRAALLLALALCFAPGSASWAAAFSAEWTLKNESRGHEQVILNFEGIAPPLDFARNGARSVEIAWPALRAVYPAGIIVPAPAEAALFDGIEPGPDGLLLRLKTPAFGFVYSVPQSGVLQIDLFNSPLGARWTPANAAAPAPVPAPLPAQAQTPAPAPLPAPAPVQTQAPAQTPPQPETVIEFPVRPAPEPLLEMSRPGPVLTPERPPQPLRSGQGEATPDAAPPAAVTQPITAGSGQTRPVPPATSGQPVSPVSPVPPGQPVPSASVDGAVQPAATVQPPAPAAPLADGLMTAPPDAAPQDSRPPARSLPVQDLSAGTPEQNVTPPTAPVAGTPPPPEQPAAPDNFAPPIPMPSIFSDRLPAPAPDALDDAEEQEPIWAPLDMPSRLPDAPVPPSYSGGEQSSLTPRRPLPAFRWSDLWPFGVSAAYAAEPDEDTILIEAPFIFRTGISRDGAPAKGETPVYVRVPSDWSLTGAGEGPGAAVAPHETGGPGTTVSPPPAAPPAAPPAGQAPAKPGASAPAAGAGNASAPPAAARETSPAAKPAGAAGQAPAGEVIYKDEHGNIVDPPLNPREASYELERLINGGSLPEAVALAEKLLRQSNLTSAQRETFLHRRADAIFTLHRDEPAKFFKEIMDSSSLAVNFNSRSPRNAGAWLRMGYVNLKAGNAYEAEAYFTLLRQQFPKDETVPLSFYYMGDFQYEQGNLNDAVLQFMHVVQEFPDSRYSRDAALGLTRAFYRQGLYEKAYEVIDYVEKRWPRYYLNYTPVLSLLGDTAYRARQADRAREAYWLYYNLNPDSPDADTILTRLGDIYFTQKHRAAATHVYEEAVRRFPNRDGGIIAMMRLAENSINDDPTLAGMFRVFKQPYNLRPAEAYRKIIKESPDNPLAQLAKLKLAMWNVYQKDFEAALRLCNEIVMANPNGPLAAKAMEVARNAFALLAAESVTTRRYERVRAAWDRYPLLHTQEEFLDPESRLALAVSQWEGADPDAALHTLEPFFLGHKIPEYSEMALLLALTVLGEYDRWNEVEGLLQRVELWELTPETRRQADYAVALAYENQGKSPEAMPIWKNLYEQNALPPEQQAYADYFLARQAEKDRDLETAYRIGQDALARLKELAALNPQQADNEKIKTLLGSLMNIAQNSGLLQSALDYGNEYLSHAARGSDDYLSVMYNLAALHQRRGSMGEWEKILTDLSTNFPATYYGRAAASQLAAYRMNRDAAQFAPAGAY